METIETKFAGEPGKRSLDQRLEPIAWGLLFIMLGGLTLMPDRWVPEGTWLVGTGIILLGINAVRYVNGIRMRGFSLGLGAVMLVAGVSDMTGVDLPVIPLALIGIGASILYRVLAKEPA